MSREAERRHLTKATQIVKAIPSWSYAKLDKFQFPWPKGALKVTQLKPGSTYKHYNIDNIGPQHGSLVYYVGKKSNEHVFRYGSPRGMQWSMYKFRGEWVCCSGADRVAFFGPYKNPGKKSVAKKSKAKKNGARGTVARKTSRLGGASKSKAGRKGPAQSALQFALGTKKRGLDGKMWKIIRMKTASGIASKRWQRISKA